VFPLSKSIGRLKIATVAKIETKEAFKIKILLLIRFEIFSLILKK
jgi:hypothetical protein